MSDSTLTVVVQQSPDLAHISGFAGLSELRVAHAFGADSAHEVVARLTQPNTAPAAVAHACLFLQVLVYQEEDEDNPLVTLPVLSGLLAKLDNNCGKKR